jgi:hypothetical protein
MKRIVYIDGGKLAVCTPVINTFPEPEDITEDEAVARALVKIPATATDVRILPESAIPATREFRALWVYNADKTAVIVDPVAQTAALAEKTRLAEYDQTLKADTVMTNIAGMSNPQWDTFWGNRTAAQKDLMLKFLVRAEARRRVA